MSEKSDAAGEALRSAYPPPLQPTDLNNYVTRIELSSTVKTLETKIEVVELKQRNWVLGGCVALLLAFGGGWVTLFAKVDGLGATSARTLDLMDKRAIFMERQEEANRRQDQALQRIDGNYQGLPYREPPE